LPRTHHSSAPSLHSPITRPRASTLGPSPQLPRFEFQETAQTPWAIVHLGAAGCDTARALFQQVPQFWPEQVKAPHPRRPPTAKALS